MTRVANIVTEPRHLDPVFAGRTAAVNGYDCEEAPPAAPVREAQPPPDVGGILNGHHHAEPAVRTALEDFIAVDEPGAEALVGTANAVLIPEDGDVMIYGDGGAGKTTLSIDLACHLGAGQDWLGIPVARPARVLLIESEGPRAMFRRKLRRKFEAWPGQPLARRVSVFERPWGEFTFAAAHWRSELAAMAVEPGDEIDVVIAGPISRLGMDEAGTLQQVRDFMRLVGDVRSLSKRRVTVILIHHENKGGAVSGAWEGAGDTLFHVEGRGNGYTSLRVQKARWSSEHHGITFELAWTAGEGFTVKDDRDLGAEIEALLADGEWRIAKEIAAPKDAGGVGANVDTIRDWLVGHPDTFVSLTGEAAKRVGRSPRATVWGRTQPSGSVESVSDFLGVGRRTDSTDSTLRESVDVESHPQHPSGRTQTSESVDAEHGDDDEASALNAELCRPAGWLALKQRLREIAALPDAEAEAAYQALEAEQAVRV